MILEDKKEVKNVHKVPKSLWSTFTSDLSKRVFNDTLSETKDIQEELIHPEQPIMEKEQWITVCWNIACHAAWSVDNEF